MRDFQGDETVKKASIGFVGNFQGLLEISGPLQNVSDGVDLIV